MTIGSDFVVERNIQYYKWKFIGGMTGLVKWFLETNSSKFLWISIFKPLLHSKTMLCQNNRSLNRSSCKWVHLLESLQKTLNLPYFWEIKINKTIFIGGKYRGTIIPQKKKEKTVPRIQIYVVKIKILATFYRAVICSPHQYLRHHKTYSCFDGIQPP